MSFNVCPHGRDERAGCKECLDILLSTPTHDNILRCVHGRHFDKCDKCNVCPHGNPQTELCSTCVAQKLIDKLEPSGEIKNEYGRSLTPTEFSCAILEKLNANIKVETVEVRTLCLMIQEQATQLRTIREVTNQGVRSGRVVG